MPRSIGRELATKMLYATYCGGGGSASEIWEMTSEDADQPDKRNIRQAEKLVANVLSQQEILDEKISSNLKKWSLERVDVLDLCALRIACWEICCQEALPSAISIKEAMAFADTYSGEKSAIFIHGVLSGILRSQKSDVPEQSQQKAGKTDTEETPVVSENAVGDNEKIASENIDGLAEGALEVSIETNISNKAETTAFSDSNSSTENETNLTNDDQTPNEEVADINNIDQKS